MGENSKREIVVDCEASTKIPSAELLEALSKNHADHADKIEQLFREHEVRILDAIRNEISSALSTLRNHDDEPKAAFHRDANAPRHSLDSTNSRSYDVRKSIVANRSDVAKRLASRSTSTIIRPTILSAPRTTLMARPTTRATVQSSAPKTSSWTPVIPDAGLKSGTTSNTSMNKEKKGQLIVHSTSNCSDDLETESEDPDRKSVERIRSQKQKMKISTQKSVEFGTESIAVVQRRESEFTKKKQSQWADSIMNSSSPALLKKTVCKIVKEVEGARAGAGNVATRLFRKKDLKQRAGGLDLNMELDEMGCLRRLTCQVVESRIFEIWVSLLIVGNAVVIGVFANWSAENARTRDIMNDTPPIFKILERFFLVSFSSELLLRAFAERLRFLFGLNWRWNMFDFLLVICAVFEEIINSSNTLGSSMTNIRMIRILRLVRVVRLIRIMRFFRELRVMVAGINSSLKSLFWALVLLLLLMFMFAVYVVQVVAEEMGDSNDPIIRTKYSSLGAMLFTLFATISNGENWAAVAAPLLKISPLYGIIYVLFIAFAVFAVLNVVTGVFVETAMQTAQRDIENSVIDEMSQHRSHMANMRAVFAEVDDDGSGFLSWEEFKKQLSNEHVAAYFRKVGLDMHDPRDLFDLLDFDGNGTIDCDEFVLGCTQLKGNAKSLDVARLRHDIVDVHASVSVLMSLCEEEFLRLRRNEESETGTHEPVPDLSETDDLLDVVMPEQSPSQASTENKEAIEAMQGPAARRSLLEEYTGTRPWSPGTQAKEVSL